MRKGINRLNKRQYIVIMTSDDSLQESLEERDLLLESILSSVENGVFVAIGTQTSWFADKVLSINKTSKLFCIDDSLNNQNDDANNNLTTKYGDRVQFVSNDAVTMIPDNIDFLHIDGNNSYKFVKQDLKNYFPKVKTSGFVMGCGDSLTNAFTEFIIENNLTGAGSNDRIFFKKTTHPTVTPCPKNDIVFVTMLNDKDVERFMERANSFHHKLVVYVKELSVKELSVKELNVKELNVKELNVKELSVRRLSNPKIQFIDFNSVKDTFAKKYTTKKHNKINCIRDAKRFLPDNMFYMWIDSEFVNNEIIPKNVNIDKPNNQMSFYSIPNDIISCLSFIVPNSLVEAFEILYEYKLIEFQTRCIANDDQNIVLQLFMEHPDLFNCVKIPVFLSLYI
jgi:hypothetical protein